MAALDELGRQTPFDRETIGAEEDEACVEVRDGLFCNRSDKGFGFRVEAPARKGHGDVRVRASVLKNEERVRDDLDPAFAGEVLDHEGAGRTRFDHDAVVVTDHGGGGARNPFFLLNAVVLAQVDITVGGRPGSSVRANEVALVFEFFQGGADGDERDVKILGEGTDADLAVHGEAIEDVARALWTPHTHHLFVSLRETIALLPLQRV